MTALLSTETINAPHNTDEWNYPLSDIVLSLESTNDMTDKHTTNPTSSLDDEDDWVGADPSYWDIEEEIPDDCFVRRAGCLRAVRRVSQWIKKRQETRRERRSSMEEKKSETAKKQSLSTRPGLKRHISSRRNLQKCACADSSRDSMRSSNTVRSSSSSSPLDDLTALRSFVDTYSGSFSHLRGVIQNVPDYCATHTFDKNLEVEGTIPQFVGKYSYTQCTTQDKSSPRNQPQYSSSLTSKDSKQRHYRNSSPFSRFPNKKWKMQEHATNQEDKNDLNSLVRTSSQETATHALPRTIQDRNQKILMQAECPSNCHQELEHWSDVWTYKCSESWKMTLCHSWVLLDGLNYDVSQIMERIITLILSDLYVSMWKKMDSGNDRYSNRLTHRQSQTKNNLLRSSLNLTKHANSPELHLHDMVCWKNALLLIIGTRTKASSKESMVEIFVHLTRQEHCIASDSTPQGAYKLSISGKGQVGQFADKIHKGGYDLIMKSIDSALEGIDHFKEVACPDCLAHHAVSKASSWKYDCIAEKHRKNDATWVICNKGHVVDIRLLTGWSKANSSAIFNDIKNSTRSTSPSCGHRNSFCPSATPVMQLLPGVVLVGLWDGKAKKIKRIGSGFVVDRKLGLIVTASHILINMGNSEDSNCKFGADYDGTKHGKAVIGIIPPPEPSPKNAGKEYSTSTNSEAVFRYFAEIVAKDVHNVDACVLRITTKMEKDVAGQGEHCGDMAEIPLVNDQSALKKEKLTQLKVTRHFELQEQVRILGYNQGGEGLVVKPGMYINRHFDFACGYICKHFKTDKGDVFVNPLVAQRMTDAHHQNNIFCPREEIVVICPTIAGHSGGPCVNSIGEVIGVLSRVDSSESQRCYVSPASEWKHLLKKAKKACSSSNPMDMFRL